MRALDQLLRNARSERCQLRHFWDLGEHLPGRDQAKLAHGLARIVPATVERDGRRVRCEQTFELRPKDRRRLVLAMLADGASRSEILSSVPGLSDRTLRHIASHSATQSRTATPDSPPANRIPERRFRQKREVPVPTPSEDPVEPRNDLADLPNCTDHCSGCGGHFASLEAFDSHRVGPWSDRRCGGSGLVKITDEGVCQIDDPDQPKLAVALYGLEESVDRQIIERREAVPA